MCSETQVSTNSSARFLQALGATFGFNVLKRQQLSDRPCGRFPAYFRGRCHEEAGRRAGWLTTPNLLLFGTGGSRHFSGLLEWRGVLCRKFMRKIGRAGIRVEALPDMDKVIFV